jgi:intermediate peptidase
MFPRTAGYALRKPLRLTAGLRECSQKQGFTASYKLPATIPASADDRILVALFDQPKLSSTSSHRSPTGLFQHRSLDRPQALISLANATLVRSQLLTKRILRARQSRDELRKVVKNLDRLSEMLCGVIDLTELIRNAHPERVWVESANSAYEMLCETMNVLNTHVKLYDVCRTIAYQSSIQFMDGFGIDLEDGAIGPNPRCNSQTGSTPDRSCVLA